MNHRGPLSKDFLPVLPVCTWLLSTPFIVHHARSKEARAMGGPSRKVGKNNGHKQKLNKQLIRKNFELRHIDQVWEDVRKPAAEVHQPGKAGPMGTTAK